MSILKKLLLITLALLLLIAVPAFAAKHEIDGDFQFEYLEDGTAEVWRYHGPETTVVIPDTLGGVPVTSIQGLDPMVDVTKVVIPASVVSMPAHIDNVDTALNELQYPSNPFASIDNLLEIEVDAANPAFVVIDNVLFARNGDALSLVCYPKGLTAAAYAVPEGTVSIGYNAMRGAQFAEVTFPDTLTGLSRQALCECKNLLRVELPPSVTEVSSSLLSNCSSLTEAILPDAITELPTSVFFGCSSLRSVKLPAQLTTLGPCAFMYCESLTHLDLPATLAEIGEDAFRDCAFQP